MAQSEQAVQQARAETAPGFLHGAFAAGLVGARHCLALFPHAILVHQGDAVRRPYRRSHCTAAWRVAVRYAATALAHCFFIDKTIENEQRI
jgi:hypothetical protein